MAGGDLDGVGMVGERPKLAEVLRNHRFAGGQVFPQFVFPGRFKTERQLIQAPCASFPGSYWDLGCL